MGLPCLKYLESFAKMRDAAFKFVSLRPKIASNRSLSLIDAKMLFARANAFKRITVSVRKSFATNSSIS